MEARLFWIFKQKSREGGKKIDLYRIVGWYNLFNAINSHKDSASHVKGIKAALPMAWKDDLEELSRLVECEHFFFQQIPAHIPLQDVYEKSLESL